MTLMATTTIPKIALALQAYGFEFRLWKEGTEREWGATLYDGVSVLSFRFEEDNLTLAKLHVLGDARTIAMSRSEGSTLPGCDTYIDSWKPTKLST